MTEFRHEFACVICKSNYHQDNPGEETMSGYNKRMAIFKKYSRDIDEYEICRNCAIKINFSWT